MHQADARRQHGATLHRQHRPVPVAGMVTPVAHHTQAITRHRNRQQAEIDHHRAEHAAIEHFVGQLRVHRQRPHQRQRPHPHRLPRRRIDGRRKHEPPAPMRRAALASQHRPPETGERHHASADVNGQEDGEQPGHGFVRSVPFGCLPSLATTAAQGQGDRCCFSRLAASLARPPAP